MNTAKKLQKTPLSDPPSRKKLYLSFAVAGGALLLGLCIWGIIASCNARKPDPKTDANAALQYLGSDRFKKLSLDDKKTFVASFGDDRRALFQKTRDLPEEQRRQIFDNMRAIRQAEENARMKKFFAMSKEEQNRQLDEDIAKMQQRRKEMEERRKANAAKGNGGGSGGGPGGNSGAKRTPPSAQARREREASSNPAGNAQRQVYFSLMRQRQQQTSGK